MRIIAGSARGRRLRSPKTGAIRPTGDRIRESIFSILGPLEGAIVVDAFAGSGALGLEALSRGAEKAYFFDPSREAIETIQENVERVGVEDRAIVKRRRFEQGLKTEVPESCDLIFLDPPYGKGLDRKALEAMAAEEEIISPGALVVWEMGSDQEAFVVEGFEIEDERIYGASRVVFLRRLAGEEEIS